MKKILLLLFISNIYACDVCSGVLSSTSYGLGLNNLAKTKIWTQMMWNHNSFGTNTSYNLGRYQVKNEFRGQLDFGVQYALNNKWSLYGTLPIKYFEINTRDTEVNTHSSYKALGDVSLSVSYQIINKVDSLKDKAWNLMAQLNVQLPTGKNQLRDEINQWKYHSLAQPGLGAYLLSLDLDNSWKIKRNVVHWGAGVGYGFENESGYQVNWLLNTKIGYLYAIPMNEKLNLIPGAYANLLYNSAALFQGTTDPLSEQASVSAMGQLRLEMAQKWNVNLIYQEQLVNSNTNVAMIQAQRFVLQLWYTF